MADLTYTDESAQAIAAPVQVPTHADDYYDPYSDVNRDAVELYYIQNMPSDPYQQELWKRAAGEMKHRNRREEFEGLRETMYGRRPTIYEKAMGIISPAVNAVKRAGYMKPHDTVLAAAPGAGTMIGGVIGGVLAQDPAAAGQAIYQGAQQIAAGVATRQAMHTATYLALKEPERALVDHYRNKVKTAQELQKAGLLPFSVRSMATMNPQGALAGYVPRGGLGVHKPESFKASMSRRGLAALPGGFEVKPDGTTGPVSKPVPARGDARPGVKNPVARPLQPPPDINKGHPGPKVPKKPPGVPASGWEPAKPGQRGDYYGPVDMPKVTKASAAVKIRRASATAYHSDMQDRKVKNKFKREAKASKVMMRTSKKSFKKATSSKRLPVWLQRFRKYKQSRRK